MLAEKSEQDNHRNKQEKFIKLYEKLTNRLDKIFKLQQIIQAKNIKIAI